MDKKELDMKVASIVNKGRTATPAKTPRRPSRPTKGVSSNAPPNAVNTEKGYKPTKVKQPKTAIPKPSMTGTAAPGMGKAKGAHATKGASIVHNHYYSGASDNDGDE